MHWQSPHPLHGQLRPKLGRSTCSQSYCLLLLLQLPSRCHFACYGAACAHSAIGNCCSCSRLQGAILPAVVLLVLTVLLPTAAAAAPFKVPKLVSCGAACARSIGHVTAASPTPPTAAHNMLSHLAAAHVALLGLLSSLLLLQLLHLVLHLLLLLVVHAHANLH